MPEQQVFAPRREHLPNENPGHKPGQTESEDYTNAESKEEVRRFIRKTLGGERWLKITQQQERLNYLEAVLVQDEWGRRALFAQLMSFMPDEIFDQIVSGEDAVYQNLGQFLVGLDYERSELPDSALKLAKTVEFAYGQASQERFAATAAMYALAFARKQGRGKMKDEEIAQLRGKLAHHFQKHKQRLERVRALQESWLIPPTSEGKLHYGVEIELAPETVVPPKLVSRIIELREQYKQTTKRAQSIVSPPLPTTRTARRKRLALMDEADRITEELDSLESIAQKKSEDYRDRFNAEIASISTWNAERDGEVVELQSQPTEDIYLLVQELVLLRKLGYLHYEQFGGSDQDKQRSRHFHGVHLNTGGIWAVNREDQPEENLNLLHHAEEATGLMIPVTTKEIPHLEGGVSIVKGEITRRNKVKFGEHGNRFGAEQRTFRAYNEKSFLELLVRHARKTEALRTFQVLPQHLLHHLQQISNAYELFPPRPIPPPPSPPPSHRKEFSREDAYQEHPVTDATGQNARERYQEKLRQHTQTEAEYSALKYYDPSGSKFVQKLQEIRSQVTEKEPELLRYGLSEAEIKMIALWVEYRFKVSLAFRFCNLPDPFARWGFDQATYEETSSPERGKLYQTIARSFKTQEQFPQAAKRLPGRGIRFDGKKYTNIMQLLREIDIEMSRQIGELEKESGEEQQRP